jgi:glycolate oxidase FAD binding subunit
VRAALHEACGDVGEGPASEVLGAGLLDSGQLASGADEVGGADGAGAVVFTARPASTEEAAAVMRVAAAHELAVLLRGAGSRLGWGRPASRCDLVIDTTRLSGVVEHAAGDLVARVRAGTPMAEVAAVLAEAGQEIALDVPGEATIGGVVASGLAGPRRLRYGTPRDLLIGVTMVRADGTVAKSGGKVVKNVAGYDLGKLLAGSDGTLGLITEATFRLHPLPAARAWVTASYDSAAAAAGAVAAAANSPLTASAVEISRRRPGGPARVGVLLEGSADGVAARAAGMAGLLRSPDGAGRPAEVSASPPSWWPGAGAVPAAPGGIRVSCWVSALGRVLAAIDAAGHAAGVQPVISGPAGAGLLTIEFLWVVAGTGTAGEEGVRRDAEQAAARAARRAEKVADFTGRLRTALAGERGQVTVVSAAPAVRSLLAGSGGLDDAVPGLALMRAVKDRFDPGHRLAPGRSPGGA